MSITEVEKAYIAGFFDGEGCVNIKCLNKKTKGGTKILSELTIELSNNDFNVLNFIKDRVGGRITKRIDENHPHSLRMESIKAVVFLETIHPYLITKKEQAGIGIKFQSLIGRRGQRVTNLNERLHLVASIKNNRKLMKHNLTGGN